MIINEVVLQPVMVA